MSFEIKIQEVFNQLSPAQKKIAKIGLEKKEELAMLTISEFALMAEVSEASITRFVRKLGFTSYSQFQSSMKQQMRQRINTIDKMQNSMEWDEPSNNIIKYSIEKDKNTMDMGFYNLESQQLERIIEQICHAKTIYLVGLGSAKALIEFLSYRFRWMGLSIKTCTVGGTELFENLVMLSKEDVLISVGFRTTYKEIEIALEYAKKKGAYTIGIAEALSGSIMMKSDISLPIKRGPEGEWNSLAFPMSVCNMIVVGVLNKRKDEALKIANDLQWLKDQFNQR